MRDDFDEKQFLIYHVLYEIQIYQQTLIGIHHFLKEIEQKIVYFNILKNTLFESHLIHLRNIFLFFRQKSSNKTDIIITTVLKKWDNVFDVEDEFKK